MLPLGKNERVVIYTNREEAETYAKSLLPILKNNGYFFSKVWVEKISVHITIPNAYSAVVEPGNTWEDDNRYIIRLKVQ